MTNEMTNDTRTSHGYYREERINGVLARLYCGDQMNDWLELTGDPEQCDIEDEIAEVSR
jgi:hypothetical protein